jgi:hypothetical protein
MTQAKPMITPTMAIAGNSTWPSVVLVAFQPATALIRSSVNNTAVALIVPLTVMAPTHGLTGPSSIRVPASAGAGHTCPPGLGASGAAHPACASASFFSFIIGLGTGHSVSRPARWVRGARS